MTRTIASNTIGAEPHRQMMRRAVIASAAGTTIEWYDFFRYGVVATLVFPQTFFPGSDRYVATLLAFSTYADSRREGASGSLA